MNDREKVIKGLEYHLKELSVGKTCFECPYCGDNPCEIHLIADAVALLKNIGTKYINVVRCEDCICWENPSEIEKQDGSTMGHCRNHYGACADKQTDALWFCADGVKA